jgi:hypothetical protein
MRRLPYAPLLAAVLLVYPIAAIVGLKFYVAFLALCIGYVLATRATAGRFAVPTDRATLLGAAYLGALALSCFTGLWPVASAISWAMLLPYVALYLLARRAVGERGLEALDWVVRLVPFVSLAVVAVTYAVFGSVRATSHEMGEVVGSLSNLIVAITAPCLPFLLGSILGGRRISWVWPSIAASITVLLASQSRAALLLLVLILVLVPLYGVSFRARLRHIGRVAFGLILTGGLLVAVAGVDKTIVPVVERVSQSQLLGNTSTPDRASSDFVRAVMYYEGLRVVRAKPITGIGYGGLSPWIESRWRFPVVSHNLIITAWGEIGTAAGRTLVWHWHPSGAPDWNTYFNAVLSDSSRVKVYYRSGGGIREFDYDLRP